jgi:CheY-like chemotaxis protein
MRILSAITNALRLYFAVGNQEWAYKRLMLIVSLFVTSAGFVGYAIYTYMSQSFWLSMILCVSSVLNIVNLILIKKNHAFKFSAYMFVVTYSLSMAYLLFDGGRSGYGFIWFYSIPVMNISILGMKKGTLFSLVFAAYLALAFLLLPDYVFDSGMYNELKPRLLVSFMALIIVILFREWTMDLFKEDKDSEGKVLESNLEYNRLVVSKLSSQIRHITTEILDSISDIKKYKPKDSVLESVNVIHESSLNLINVINGMSEYSELDFSENAKKMDYNLFSTIDKTIDLFSSYKTKVNTNIDKSLPAVIHGNPLVLKQIIYNIIEKLVDTESNSDARIEMDVTKGAESGNFVEIRFVITALLSDVANEMKHKMDCKFGDISLVEDNYKIFKEIGLQAILPLVHILNGKIQYEERTNLKMICFNYKLVKDENYKPESINELSYSSSLIQNQTIDNLSKKKLNKMHVLLMEDNLITQKSILFSIEKTVRQIDIASNGKEGLDMFFKHKYDLILLDINMPVMDGFEVANRIRSLEQGTKIRIPIIAVISDYMSKDIEKILSSGADEYITKPFKTADLIKKMNTILVRDKE